MSRLRSRPFFVRLRLGCVAVLVALLLTACGQDEPDREFAPEINDEALIETRTPIPTGTPPPLDRQPGESGPEGGDANVLINQEGAAVAIAFGLADLSVVSIESGEHTSAGVPRSTTNVSAISPDGSLLLTIERLDGRVRVVSRDTTGEETGAWEPATESTPQASPVAQDSVQIADRVVWDPQSQHAVVAIGGVGVFVADRDLHLTAIAPGDIASVTAAAWSPAGQTVALATWEPELQSAAIQTASLQDLNDLTTVLELPEGEGRFVRSLAWGNERVGLVFALRSLSAGFSLPSDLYHLPRFGQPMRLLATAGAAAPAAVVDQVAIAGNGSTVAYTVLIPGEVGLRYHSLWVTDAEGASTARIETPGLRRVSDLVWTSQGLAVVGTRRESENDAQFQSSVVELVTPDGLTEVGVVRSEATPVGSLDASPQASPGIATPAS